MISIWNVNYVTIEQQFTQTKTGWESNKYTVLKLWETKSANDSMLYK